MIDQKTTEFIYGLTHPQKRVWQSEHLYPATPVNNLAGGLILNIPLDFDRLETIFNLLVKTYSATRIRIIGRKGQEPQQYIAPFTPFSVEVIDFSSQASPYESFQKWLRQQAKTVFKLFDEPLFRVKFIRLSPNECGYFVNFHHLIADGWSFQIMARFISHAYSDLSFAESVFDSHSIMIEKEKRYINSPQFKRDKNYWLGELHGLVPYPLDVSDSSGEQLSVTFSSDTVSHLKSIASQINVGFNTILTALLFVFLGRCEGIEQDIVVGMPIHNRSGVQNDAVGMFTSTMPLRINLIADDTLATFVRRVQSSMSRCFRHQRYPYDLLTQDIFSKTKNPGQLFRACMNIYATDLLNSAQSGNKSVVLDECYTDHQLFPLYVVVKQWAGDQSLQINVNYKPSQYSRVQIEALVECLSGASWASQGPNVKLDALMDMLPDFSEAPTNRKTAQLPRSLSSKEIKFPATVEKEDRKKGLSEIPFIIPPALRLQVKNTFESEGQCFEHVLAVSTCALLSRCCATETAALVVYLPEGELREFNIDVARTTTFRKMVLSSSWPGIYWDNLVGGLPLGVMIDIADGLSGGSNADFTIVIPHNPEAPGKIVFNTELYDREDAERLSVSLLRVIQLAAEMPDNNVDEFEVVGLAEQLLLEKFNATETEFSRSATIISEFENAVARSPDKVAIRTGGETWSYARLNGRANQVARLLRKRGISRGSIVAISMERSANLMVGILGILKAGGAYLPIDPSYPSSRIGFILQDCQSQLIICDRHDVELQPGCEVQILDDKTAKDELLSSLSLMAESTDLVYICYTSGSTGNPKGVMIEHRSLINRLNWMQRTYHLDVDDILLLKTSISFDVSVWELFWWILADASLCISAPGDESNPEHLLDLIERSSVTVVHFVPSMLQVFMDYLEQSREVEKLGSLRRVFASGEALLPNHVNTFNRLLTSSGTRLSNLYGPTEATIDVTYYNCDVFRNYTRVPIGKPIDNTRLRILNSGLKHQPIGSPGNLYIGGVGVARGYLNRRDLTDEKFIEDPYIAGERLYNTGDMARWLPSGDVEFLGRNDNQVKLRGYRIEFGEIEAALREHPSVQNAIVALQASPSGAKHLFGYVVLSSPCAMHELREHLTSKLPAFMVPASLQEIEAIPLSFNGKADRSSLPEPSWNNVHTEECSVEEVSLLQIWRKVLEIPTLGVEDNFFALGGDSIKVISLIATARASGMQLTTQDVYQHPTVRKLVQVLRKAPAEEVRHRQPFELLSVSAKEQMSDTVEDAYPLSVLQLGLLFQSQIQRVTPFYHDVFSYSINGVFDPVRFKDAVRILCHRHQIFRTSFHLGGYGVPIQMVHKQVVPPLKIRDLREVPYDVQQRVIQADIAEVRKKIFDWVTPCLIGFHIHILTDVSYVYTIDFHDSALDGWSVNLIHRELFECYNDLLLGKLSLRQPLATQFRDFVELEQKALSNAEHKKFWADRLAGASYIRLPRSSGHKLSPEGEGVDVHDVELSYDLSAAVKQTANRLGVPVKCVLLAAHVYVLSVLSGESDITTGYEYGARPETVDGDRVIGLFLNTLPLRVDVTSESWEDLIRRLYRAEIEFVPHRRYPMAQIKRDLKIHGPLFENVFNFTHFHILKGLQDISGFDLSRVEIRAETEFVFRAECYSHPFTDDLFVQLHYHTDCFSREQIRRIGGYYTRTMAMLTRDTSASPQSICLLSEEETHQQLYEFNKNEMILPDGKCFHHLFEMNAASMSERRAVTCGSHHWTYKELNQAANRLAHRLLRKKAGLSPVVAVAMPRGLAWMASMLACFKSGCVYLPIDIGLPQGRIDEILDQSDCRFVLVQDSMSAIRFSNPGDNLQRSHLLEVIDVALVFNEEQNTENPLAVISPDDLAYVIFTSGSTGRPKGAMIEHRGMLNHLLAKVNDLSLNDDDVLVQNASQCFDISIWQLLCSTLTGGRVVIVEDEIIRDVSRFVAGVVNSNTSVLEVVPSYLEILLDSMKAAATHLGRLRALLVTGEVVPIPLIERWFAAFPNIAVINAYGPTEASDDICHHIMRKAPHGISVPVGKPIQNLSVYVLNDRLQLVPIGTHGEVCVAGIGVGRGYINEPKLTTDVFVQDPFQPDRRMYRTGDVGRWSADGILELEGRQDDQIKIRGHRIEIGEIESRMGQCDGIKRAAVVADIHKASLIGFLVSEKSLDLSQIKRNLSFHLPSYMVPSKLIQVPALPLSANGKIVKSKLLALANDNLQYSQELFAPVGATEVQLASLWADVLELDIEQVKRSSDFFELGGDSLKAMTLALKGNNQFSINDVFKFPILQDFATRVESLVILEEKQEILIDFSRRSVTPRLTVIGFTYAGGDAVNFQPFFHALQDRRPDIACYAVQIPRGNNALVGGNTLVQLCLEKIRNTIQTPVILWGHCAGSALALEVAKELEASNFDLRWVVLGGKVIENRLMSGLLSTAAQIASPFVATDAASMSTSQIRKWLERKTKFDGFAGLNEDAAESIALAFREDASHAAQFFDHARDRSKAVQIQTPILNIVAPDDPLTKGYPKKYKNWRLFSGRVDLAVLESGGHYFIKTHAVMTANLFLEYLAEQEPSQAPRSILTLPTALEKISDYG